MNILSLTHLTVITFTFIVFILIAFILNPDKENEEKSTKYIKYSALIYIVVTCIPIILELLRT